MNFAWIHSLAESWMVQASQRPLAPWKRALLLRHLSFCAHCRSLALALVEFSYGFAGRPRPSLRQTELLHRRVMEAYHRIRGLSGSEPSAPAAWPGLAVRPSFAYAMAATLLLVAGLFYFSTPLRPPEGAGPAQFKPRALAAFPPPTAEPELSPTPTPATSPAAPAIP